MCEALEISKRVYAKTEKLLRLCESVENANCEAFAEIVRQVKEIEEEKGNVGLIKPQPCTKFRNAETIEWVAKLAEETSEVVQEAKDMDECVQLEERLSAAHAKDRLAEELTDVITLCTSWLHALGYDEYLRGEVQKRVNEKNRERGYC